MLLALPLVAAAGSPAGLSESQVFGGCVLRAGGVAGRGCDRNRQGRLPSAAAGRIILILEQVGEAVEAAGIGCRLERGRAAAVGPGDRQGDGHAGDAGLAGILDAVAVQVLPDEVAQGGRLLVVAEVGGGVVLAAGHGDGVGIELAVVVAAGVRSRWTSSSR